MSQTTASLKSNSIDLSLTFPINGQGFAGFGDMPGRNEGRAISICFCGEPGLVREQVAALLTVCAMLGWLHVEKNMTPNPENVQRMLCRLTISAPADSISHFTKQTRETLMAIIRSLAERGEPLEKVICGLNPYFVSSSARGMSPYFGVSCGNIERANTDTNSGEENVATALWVVERVRFLPSHPTK